MERTTCRYATKVDSPEWVWTCRIESAYGEGMLVALITIGAITLAALFKRLLIRRKHKLPYRRPESHWPRRSYREPS